MRIDRLDLLTNDLAVQGTFYARELPLPVLEASEAVLALRAGRSQLTFRQAPEGWDGFYHFAFNIPEDQFREAKGWLSKRIMLIKDDKGDDEFSSSKEWNADSIYFYDAAGNILEFIARHDLEEHLDRPFDEGNILSISEIGIVTEDVGGMVRSLQSQMGLRPYGGPASETFAAVGDEHGLLIVVKHGRVWFPDTGKQAVEATLGVAVTSDMGARYKLSGPPYHIGMLDDGLHLW